MGNDPCSVPSACCKANLQLNDELRYEEYSLANRPPTHKVSGSMSNTTRMAVGANSHSMAINRKNKISAEKQRDYAERLLRLEECVHFSKLCELKVMQSATLAKNTVFRINAMGLENSKRLVHDGFTYIGCKRRLNSEYSDIILNDIVIPNKESQYDELHRGRHFQISFEPSQDAYFVKDLGVGFGAFVKVDSEFSLKDNDLIQVGDTYISILIPSDDSSQLKLTVIGGSRTGEAFIFEGHESSSISIGRLKDCNVILEDFLVSKHQAQISFSHMLGWTLQDGAAEDRRSSTNGTW